MGATDLKRELREQARWKPKPGWSGSPFFEGLIVNEFLSRDEHAARSDQAVRNLMAYAGQCIPHYRKVLEERGLSLNDIDGMDKLRLLPILSRSDIQERYTELSPPTLPPGQTDAG